MKVVELWQYPIKSCAGVSLQQAETMEEGFVGDRRLQWVADNGRFVSQREFPHLALVQASWNKDMLEITYTDRSWTITPEQFSQNIAVSTWSDEINAEAYVGPLNKEMSELLGTSITLVRLPNRGRSISDSCANGFVSFADGLPFLLTNMKSLTDLNSRLTKPVTMQQFRANIVIDGDLPYQEDNWNKIMIGEVLFHAVKPCSRCVMTTINPKTAQKSIDAEPLKTLASYRMIEQGKIIFGMNMTVATSGIVSVGDRVMVL